MKVLSIILLFICTLCAVSETITDKNFDASLHCTNGRVGVVLIKREKGVTIGSLIPGGSASKSGKISFGDYLLSVQQFDDPLCVDVENLALPEIVRLITGPAGSTVILHMRHASKDNGNGLYSVELLRQPLAIDDHIGLTEGSWKQDVLQLEVERKKKGERERGQPESAD